MPEVKAPKRDPRIQFSHFGMNVRDLEKMEDFYTRVIGFTVTDRGKAVGLNLSFLSMDPLEHHQLVLCTGEPDELGENKRKAIFGGPVNQVSFRLEALDDLRIMYNRLKNEVGEDKLLLGNHCISWSVYGHDPEGNTVEFFVDSPWFVDQPFFEPFDLSKTDDEIFTETEAMARAMPGFQPYTARRETFARMMGREIVAKPFQDANS